jgi:FixJ family two-component response regulator
VNAQLVEGDPARPPTRTPIIAVVDDEASVRKALGRLLRAAGYEACTYASGQEFLAACRTDPPDCVVLDMHMPEMSGLEIQRRLNDSAIFVPMVFITADDESRSCQRSLDAGAVAWLRKPVDGPVLINRLELALEQARTVYAMNLRLTAVRAR